MSALESRQESTHAPERWPVYVSRGPAHPARRLLRHFERPADARFVAAARALAEGAAVRMRHRRFSAAAESGYRDQAHFTREAQALKPPLPESRCPNVISSAFGSHGSTATTSMASWRVMRPTL
jgi:hypothetical protein